MPGVCCRNAPNLRKGNTRDLLPSRALLARMRTSIDIPGVGTFVHQPGGELYRHYEFELPRKHARPTLVLVYLQVDDVPAHYAMHVRQVFTRATQHHAEMLVAARHKVERLMTQYGLALPPDYHAFADSLELTHVKPFPDGGAELIFGVCSWFPNFDLNAALDADLAIAKVWFDG